MIKEILFRQLHPKTVRQVLYVVYAVMLLITWHYASLVMEFQKITPAKLIHVFSETRQAEAASVTISGTVYTNQGVTTMGSGRTVRILKNGTDMSKSTTTNGFGAFSISSVNTSAEDVLTVYLDNATENGAVVTLSNATDIADLNIYQNYLITRTESGTALTNANLDTANNADPGLSSDDLTSLYDVSGGTLTTTTGTELLIKNSFTPGGAIDAGGTIDVDGLFDASTYAINVAGDWDISVMITHSGNLTFDGTGAQVYTNSTSMNSTMVINKSSGTLTAASWLKPMTGNITLTSGTLDINGQAITGNSLIVGAAGILKLQGGESVGTPTLNAGSTVLYSNSLGEYTLSNWNYGNLTINASGATYNAPFPTFMVGGNFTMTAGTFTGNSTVIFLSGNLDLDGGTFTSTTNELRLAGNFDNSAGAPLAFNANSGTVTLNGNGQSILGATTFATLTKTGADTATAADRTLTFVNGQTTTATTLNLNGFSNAEPLLLRSNSSGLNASVTATTTNASKLDIKDVYHLNGPIDPANSTNGGNANGWFTVSILTVTAGNIAASLTTDNGTFGVAGINDILTITWNAVSGDSNTLSDIGTVRANLSNFGGGATESLYDNQTNGDVTSGDGIFTRAFTIPAGSTDAVARSFTITATNTESTATGPVTENTTFTVDNIAPTVSVACISVTGATGTNGLFKYRDTPILRWDNSNLGSGCTNNNSDIASVAFNAANFKAADTNRAGSVASNVWTASLSGAMDTQSDTNNNVTVTATDDAGNATSLAGTNNYTIYTFFPILALTNIVSPTSDVMPRNTVQYTFTITNSGTGNSPNAIFT
ncbi:hypothetical protein HZA38_06505, partial [Candidatus Peregrinibacteria bacterium]|nr:hypothetical protein [Candidatus Peregrinibacteria bacterium]